MLMVGLLLAGAVGYTQLPVSALPEVDYPIIQVITFYPGASPDVMASSVTAPLERQFGQVPGLQQMTSTSSDGSSVITLQFNLSSQHRCGRAGSAAVHQRFGNVPAGRPAGASHLQQNQSRRYAHPDAGADFDGSCRFPRWRTWPTRGWRPRSRNCRALDWSASAAARSPRSGFRPIPPRWRPTASTWKICAPPSWPPTRIRRKETLMGRGRHTRSEPTTNCSPAPTMPR